MPSPIADAIERVFRRQIDTMVSEGRLRDAEDARQFTESPGDLLGSIRLFEECTPDTLAAFPGRRVIVELRQALYADLGWPT